MSHHIFLPACLSSPFSSSSSSLLLAEIMSRQFDSLYYGRGTFTVDTEGSLLLKTLTVCMDE